MKWYIGKKDGRTFATCAKSVDEAYFNIGELMTGTRQDDSGNVDLDLFVELNPAHKTIEIKE